MIELAGNAAKDNKKQRISPRHIFLAIKNDDELNRICKLSIIPSAGAFPNIRPELMPIRWAKQQKQRQHLIASQNY